MNPAFMQSHLQLANVLTEMGEHEDASYHARRAVELEPHSALPLYVYCFCLSRSGAVDDAAKAVARWESIGQTTYVPPYFLGMANLALGDVDKCFEYLEMACLEQSPWAIWFGTEPKLDSIRHDPRYLALVKRTNNPIVERLGPDGKIVR